MYMAFIAMNYPNGLTDYIIRVAQPKMRSIPGMLDAEILGLRQFA